MFNPPGINCDSFAFSFISLLSNNSTTDGSCETKDESAIETIDWSIACRNSFSTIFFPEFLCSQRIETVPVHSPLSTQPARLYHFEQVEGTGSVCPCHFCARLYIRPAWTKNSINWLHTHTPSPSSPCHYIPPFTYSDGMASRNPFI